MIYRYTGVLDNEHFIRVKQLLGNDKTANRVFHISSGIANNMGVSDVNAVRGSRVDARVHACHWPSQTSIEASLQTPRTDCVALAWCST
jgi:hypothetical protein